jgi:predicted nucleic acid-binding protein
VILLDTNVLSEAYRRVPRGSPPSPTRAVLTRLISENHPLAVPGIVAQELLSGIRIPKQFDLVRGDLESFRLVLATVDDHVLAATIMNRCLEKGVAAKTVDCLITAQAVNHHARLYTNDTDFAWIAAHSELRLYRPVELGPA